MSNGLDASFGTGTGDTKESPTSGVSQANETKASSGRQALPQEPSRPSEALTGEGWHLGSGFVAPADEHLLTLVIDRESIVSWLIIPHPGHELWPLDEASVLARLVRELDEGGMLSSTLRIRHQWQMANAVYEALQIQQIARPTSTAGVLRQWFDSYVRLPLHGTQTRSVSSHALEERPRILRQLTQVDPPSRLLGQYTGSVGSGLFEQQRNRHLARIQRTREEHVATRATPSFLEHVEPYASCAKVSSSKVRAEMRHLARQFQHMDRAFAMYFQMLVKSDDQRELQSRVDKIEAQIAKRRFRQADQSGNKNIYLGDLGHFCQETLRLWTTSRTEGPHLDFTFGLDDDLLFYLQEALEVPYWKLMMESFARFRTNSRSFPGDLVMSILENFKVSLKDSVRGLKATLTKEEVEEGIDPLLQGIIARMNLLGSFTDSGVWERADQEPFESVSLVAFANLQAVTGTSHFPDSSNLQTFDGERLMTPLIFAFVMLAMVPLLKGFAISMSSSELGTIADADFWYLIQSSIMVMLGNITVVLPLLDQKWYSSRYAIMWAWFLVGSLLAGLSVVIYPLCNTGWSSLLAWFSSFASFAGALELTQITAREKSKASNSAEPSSYAKAKQD